MHLPHNNSGIVALLLILFVSLAKALEKPGTGEPEPLKYTPGDQISVQCLNRTIDTGEHVQDEKTGVLQYIPFATCNETGRPLEVKFLEDGEVNCTIPFLSDEMFHLFEFYVHHDSPLACRVPVRPLGGERDLEKKSDEEYVPLVFALAGKLETSHIHLATNMNVLFHLTSPTSGVIDSGAAYSISPMSSDLTRIIIGDPLLLRLKVHWFHTLSPLSAKSNGEHVTVHLLGYCLLSAFAGACGVYTFLVGWEFPKRLRKYAFDRRGGGGGAGGIIGNFGNGVGAGGRVGYGYAPGVGGRGDGGGYGYSGKRKD
ncbi:unnamed protein product [Tuber melanosporum]|uniref:(Perigord truffle) hypothetical protein n=1 Tax=Tuber melanosporum (strain Mel28) TaxID=656061 RepID=D5GJL8_TUBMM|nr:uncharacterized protein GSTUM_00009069001 [Tuber melanosporum]CAZ84711.1 unnamed protein product [Tuber melanosporum]